MNFFFLYKALFQLLFSSEKEIFKSLYCSYLLKETHAVGAASVTDEKTQLEPEKPRTGLFDHKCSEENSVLIASRAELV